MPEIIPIRDLKNTNAISQRCHETAEPIFVTKNGYGDMVIMSLKAYDEKFALLDVYEKLAKSGEQVKQGKVSDARESLKQLRSELHV